MNLKKPIKPMTILIVFILSLLSGAIIGFGNYGFSLRGFNTFFVAFLLSWIVFSLIARILNK